MFPLDRTKESFEAALDTKESMKTLEKRFRIDRREIAYLRFIFEGYDGLAVLTTLDSQAGLVALHVAPGCESEVYEIIRDLGKEIMIEPAA